MGDRNNPIKFGPEWLRNLSRERSTARSASNDQNTNPGPSVPSSPSGGAVTTTTGSSTISNTNTTGGPKVLLAKLRYGREEMLALYDKNAEAPPELKVNETLYQPRGKQPVALNNTFEDDMRDNLRGAPLMGGLPPGGVYSIGRGSTRIGSDLRGKLRGSYTPHIRPSIPPPGRGGYTPRVGNPRMPFVAGLEDDGGNIRIWHNNPLNVSNRSSGDQTDWVSKTYRSKRQGTNTNWRQPQTREEGEEWRSSEPGRSRQPEKRDRDWGDRPNLDKLQTRSINRRPRVGDTQNNEEIPEWVDEDAECGGTFDSSGAFHGYSNDDNLPKHHDPSYSLTRSHTHGGFPRPKVAEEGSEEWWASEKAKKLSPKRFDASDIKFKKQTSIGNADAGCSTSVSTNNPKPFNKIRSLNSLEELDSTTSSVEPQETTTETEPEDKFGNQNLYKSKFAESKTFNALMRSDINVEEARDERGNFQSVIITPNNSLRQKHQHIVMAADGQQHIQLNSKGNSEVEQRPIKTPEDLLVDNFFGMTMDDEEMLPTSLSKPAMSRDMNNATSSLPQNQNQSIQMSMSNTGLPSLSGMSQDMHGNTQNMQGAGMQSNHPMSGLQSGGMSSVMQNMSGIPMSPGGLQNTAGIQASGALQNLGLSSGGLQTLGMPNSGMSNSAMPNSGMPNSGMPNSGMPNSGMPNSGMPNSGMPNSGMPNSGMPSVVLQNPGLPQSGMQNPILVSVGIQMDRMQPVLQPVGMANSNVLGLPMGSNIAIVQGVPQQVTPNASMANNIGGGSNIGVMGSTPMQNSGNMAPFQSGLPGNSVGNNSLFLPQNSNSPAMSLPNEMPLSNHTDQNTMFPMHGLQHSGSQSAFGNSIYSHNGQNLADQWFYEDPEGNIQGPFSSKDMHSWYRAGFFSPSLMVRRACETMMRPLGSYGHVVPFIQMDMMPTFPMPGRYEARPQGPGAHENMQNSQTSMRLDVMNIASMNISDNKLMDTLQFGSVGLLANQSYGQPQLMVDSLWGQPSTPVELVWLQRNDNRVNNLPIYFWDQQPSAIGSNSLLPEDITKEMKTEDEILAQLRASQNMGQTGMQFVGEPQAPTPASAAKPDECSYPPLQNATPNLEELHKLIQKDTLTGNSNTNEPEIDTQVKTEKSVKLEQSSSESSVTKQPQSKVSDVKVSTTKQVKDSNDKSAKNKENNNTKNKTKKAKDEKKDDVVEIKTKEEVIKSEKRSKEPSPSTNKKEEKCNKKELEREKKEWIKEGFTIVKGSEKNTSKDNKKKAEEARAAEEAERKRKEDEKLAAEEDKKKKQAESAKKQQEQQQPQRQATESVAKKAPWSTAATQAMQATNRDGLTLAEIQRLEREKKLEQMKEQQQMMQLIAQQQAAALAREQEMQAGLGWAKKKGNNVATTGQSLAEIQAEARKQAAAAAAAQATEETQAAATVAPPPANHVPWGNAHNGGSATGFWDTQSEQPQKQTTKPEAPKVTDQSKPKKKPTVVIPKKETKETTPASEFDSWCTGALAVWSSKIDVPTFFGFLKDIESPYEVKDYVKCYLGESKDTNDFARQFLERRSKLLRVGMVTPSDDLCSPAIAVNPRTTSGSDYQEVKGKGKKAKKNKMLKVDARILGFSVTAAEDRINVGDIDTV